MIEMFDCDSLYDRDSGAVLMRLLVVVEVEVDTCIWRLIFFELCLELKI